MNRDERRACDAIAAALTEEGGEMGLAMVIGDDPGDAIACKVDVSIGQPVIMDAVTVRVTRKPVPTEVGSFPEARSVTMNGDHLDTDARREMGAIMRDLARICRRNTMLAEAGIACDDAPLWTYEMDEVSLRLLTHGCGGSLGIRKHRSAHGVPLIQYMPIPWRAPSEAPVLSGVGGMLHMPEGVVLLYDGDDARTMSINERKRRIGCGERRSRRRCGSGSRPSARRSGTSSAIPHSRTARSWYTTPGRTSAGSRSGTNPASCRRHLRQAWRPSHGERSRW